MSEQHDDSTELLLEEYALDRLHGEGLERAEALLRAQPALRARVAELREESRLLSGALSDGAAVNPGPVHDFTLALLIDGALDELERASLEASLAGDLQSQARLSDLYKETIAVMNDEPLVARNSTNAEPAPNVVPFAGKTLGLDRSADILGRGICVVLVLISLWVPPVVGVPVLFLALGVFGWWAVRRAAADGVARSRIRRSYIGLSPALVLFVAGLFAGPLGLWCYVGGAGWYWYWLIQRWAPVHVANEAVSQERVDSGEVVAGAKRG